MTFYHLPRIGVEGFRQVDASESHHQAQLPFGMVTMKPELGGVPLILATPPPNTAL